MFKSTGRDSKKITTRPGMPDNRGGIIALFDLFTACNFDNKYRYSIRRILENIRKGINLMTKRRIGFHGEQAG